MSTTTSFKRIALVAVAALGLGLLSSVPAAQAASTASITVANGTSGQNGAKTDSTTAATISVTGLLGAQDSITISAVAKSAPSGSTVTPVFYNLDSSTPTQTGVIVDSTVALTAVAAPFLPAGRGVGSGAGTGLFIETTVASATSGVRLFSANDVALNRTFGIGFDSITSNTTGRIAGTYVYTIITKTYENGNNVLGTAVRTTTTDVSIVIAATTAQSTTVSPGLSTAFMGTASTANTADAVISAVSTASNTPAAYVTVNTMNSSSIATPESITATITGAGTLFHGTTGGASLTIAGSGTENIQVRPDGRAGTATITISTTSRTFPAKTMTFYAVKPTTLVATISAPLAAIGTNTDVVRVDAKDAAGVSFGGQLYIYASSATDAAIAGAVRATVAASAVTCAVPTATQPLHVCPVTGIGAGTAKFKVTHYATAALATAAADGAEVTSNEVSVVVSQAAAATVKLEFDKASYAPGERARIYVTPLDSTGKAMQSTAFTNLLASGGISTAQALTFAGSTTTADSLTAVAITTSATSSSTSGAKAGSFQYTVYMPVSGGTVTISATGGSSLPIAGRVAVTATATVTDSGAAALAAVTALATTVASLKTLITTLTNLVLKIQKKVKA